MNYIKITLFLLFILNNLEIVANDQASAFSIDSSKLFNIPAQLGFENNLDYLSNQAIYFVDDYFQMLSLNNFGNLNFNLIKFDGIALNSLYDKSLDNSTLFADKSINYQNDFNNFANHFNNNSKSSLLLLGGSNIGNANIFIQGKIGDIKIKTRNNYYVTNGFNNPKGVIYNPISEISKQAFQSSLSLFLQDSKSLINYNQLILFNKSDNNFDDIDNFFKDASNFNSIFSLKYSSRNSELISSNGQLFLKYSNFKSRNSNLLSLIKTNELSYGLNLGLDLHSDWMPNPTRLIFKLSQHNSDLTLRDEFYKFKVEDLNFSINQELNLYKNNITQIALSYDLFNPIDEIAKINYSKISGLGLEFNYHHYINSGKFLNDNYLIIKLSNELPELKYLFARSIINDSSLKDLNYQNYLKFGSNTKIDFLNLSLDLNISYVHFNEYFYQDTSDLGTNLKESLIMNVDFSLSYWKLTLEANYLLNLLGKNFRTDFRINNLPKMIVDLKLNLNVSNKSVISLFLRNYNFNYNNLDGGFKGFPENSSIVNLKIKQNISDNIELFLSINNVLDEQIPLYPFYYNTGFNYLGGLVISF